jgi:hypothetical protein
LDGSSVLNWLICPENVTFDNSVLTAYSLNNNGAYIIYSPAPGCAMYDDGIKRVSRFTNLYISSDAPTRSIE